MATNLSFSEAFARLVSMLNEKELNWIVSQVEEQIRLGKPSTRRVKELKVNHSDFTFLVQPRTSKNLQPGREVQYPATEEYTDSERLELLLSAIHQALVSTASVGKVVAEHFPGLVFASEQGERQFAVEEIIGEGRLRAVDRLQHALKQVRIGIG